VPTAKKAAVIEDLTEKLMRANAAALIDYRGLTVAEIGGLRRQLRQREVELEVAKNTLLREAAHRTNMMDLDELFVGPTAVAFIYGDEPTGTKTLNDFFRTARVGEIKSGILKGGRRLTAEHFTMLADLPSRQMLLAQIAGLLQSPMSQLAALLNAPAQQLAYALTALVDKGGAAGAGIAAAAPAATEATAERAPETPAGSVEAAAPSSSETPAAADDAELPAPEAAAAPSSGESPADVAAADTARATEEEGGAAAEAATPMAEETGETPRAQEAAEDVSSAPESEGGAGAQP
jgi:large subunit ribosomal protein L10